MSSSIHWTRKERLQSHTPLSLYLSLSLSDLSPLLSFFTHHHRYQPTTPCLLRLPPPSFPPSIHPSRTSHQKGGEGTRAALLCGGGSNQRRLSLSKQNFENCSLRKKSERSTLAGWASPVCRRALTRRPPAPPLWASAAASAHRARAGMPRPMGRAPTPGTPYYAGVSSDRTNLSSFTKDYRGLALPCDS